MACAACGTENDAGRRFCGECGAPLTARCPRCGTLNAPAMKFCGECGTPLGVPMAPVTPAVLESPYDPSAGLERLIPREFAERLRATRGRVEPERRLVTILFCDIKGYTAMAQALDPEDVLEIVNGAFEYLIGPVYRQEGTLAQLLGDAILAFFGAPIGHDDDPCRAVRAGIEIQAGIREYAERLAAERGIEGFAVRVGINTGLVVMGEVGTDLRVSYTAVGDAINMAARMEQNAPPGGILVSEETFRYIRDDFVTLPQPPLEVKGHDEPVITYLVQGPRPAGQGTETRRVEGVETRMVGRGAELGALQGALGEAIGGGGSRLVLLTGDAGVGKSRLLGEFVRWAEERPERPDIWVGRATAATLGAPHGLLRDMLARRCGVLDSDNASAARDTFEAGITDVFAGDPSGPMRAHVIGQMLGFDFSDSPHLRGGLGEPRQVRDRARAYLADYVRAISAGRPALIALEDLHWADDSSLEALLWLVDAVTDSRVLFLGTARPALDERRPGWGAGLPSALRLQLQPLSPLASRELVLEILQQVDEIPDALRDLVVGRAEGNPFFAEELVKMLLEDGVIEKEPGDGGPWHVRIDRLTEARVPPSLTGVLQARLDRLEPAERLAVQQASVVGRRFWDGAVAHLGTAAGIAATGSAETTAAVTSALAVLERRELVFEREPSTFADCREYMFKHALVRDVAYESLLRRQRRAYHGAVADWLVRTGGDRGDEIAGLVGSHLELAGRGAEAAVQLGRAASRAAATFANEEAIQLFRRALDLLDALPPEERDAQLAATFAEGLGNVLHLVGRHAAARDAYLRPLEAGLRDDVVAEAHLYRMIGNAWVADHRFDEADEAFERAASALGTLPDDWATTPDAGAASTAAERPGPEPGWRHEWMALQSDRMMACYWSGRVDELDALIERVRPSFERWATTAERAGFFQALMMLGFRRYRYVLPDETVEHAQAFLAASREAGVPDSLAFPVFCVGFAHLWHGDLAAAGENFRASLEISERVGDVTVAARCLTYLAVLARLRDEPGQVRELVPRCEAVATGAGMPEYVGTARANAAWLAWRDGDLDATERYGRAALELWPPAHASGMFRWTALWPLIGATIARDDTAAAIGCARGLLDPSQQRVPDDLQPPLEGAVRAWDGGDAAAARASLDVAVTIASRTGRL
jgi:class 3 adenylate cyclase/tetratricopeptide (TPR) repeat protein